jgi:UDP-N-acetylglucosamine:LPS N-acetylglucosamine transferase
MLADKIWAQASALQRPIVFVEGRAGAERRIIPSHIRHIKLAAAATLQPLIEQASLVICRSGYSTLMDLARLGKRAVLIPTPGQTEQEYLANYLSGQGIFLAAKQDHFSLANAIQKAENSERNWPLPQEQADLLTPVLDQWLSTL